MQHFLDMFWQIAVLRRSAEDLPASTFLLALVLGAYLLVNAITLAVAGFPVTLAVAWFLQITPEGIVRTDSFIERRILSNLPPISDRRQASVSTYSRKGEEPQNYQWILSAETGPLVGLSFGVCHSLILGRALDCDIAVPSPQVSRNHARLELEGGKLIIEDLGSSNGTVVNGKPVSERRELHHEDEVRFHDIVFRVTEK